ncbi:response regulator [Candidatus Saccharibacteria bacterium]|nr:response regulator [Candidatus Saccharibacteria bacterium]
MSSAPKPKIVIVEDNEALAEIYRVRLEVQGYDCIVASDGAKAIEVIEREQPYLVLLDLMIPVLSGDEVLRTIRGNDWGKDIKVQIISNLNETEAPDDLREYGIEGYSVKANLNDDDIDNIVAGIVGVQPAVD